MCAFHLLFREAIKMFFFSIISIAVKMWLNISQDAVVPSISSDQSRATNKEVFVLLYFLVC